MSGASVSQPSIGRGEHWWGELVARTRSLWVSLGKLEALYLADEISDRQIDKPIYICGLARSGSTILLEIIASLPRIATHQYRDYPLVYCPVIWNFMLHSMGARDGEIKQRAHRDGIAVGPSSPEAMEEPIWMHYFPYLHDPTVSNVLDRRTTNRHFEHFYQNHIKSLLYLRNGSRYLAKGNYDVSRIAYLAKLMPEAKFIIPVRDPVSHVASLEKQNRLFSELGRSDPRVLSYMQRVGHFEFGLDRRPINFGNAQVTRDILDAWNEGDEIGGLARYWADIYGYVVRLLREDADVARRCLIVRYNELCADGESILDGMFHFMELKVTKEKIREMASRLHMPTYYKVGYTEEEIGKIKIHAEEIALTMNVPVQS